MKGSVSGNWRVSTREPHRASTRTRPASVAASRKPATAHFPRKVPSQEPSSASPSRGGDDLAVTADDDALMARAPALLGREQHPGVLVAEDTGRVDELAAEKRQLHRVAEPGALGVEDEGDREAPSPVKPNPKRSPTQIRVCPASTSPMGKIEAPRPARPPAIGPRCGGGARPGPSNGAWCWRRRPAASPHSPP